MASYRPFPPPASSFPPPPASSNQNLLPPPPYPEQNLYPQHSNFAGGGGGGSAPSNHSRNPPNVNSHHNYAPSTQSHQFSTSRTQQHSNRPPNHQQQHHHQHPPPPPQQQYPHAPPPPPSSSYPLQPPPTQPSQLTPAPQQPPNMYYPPSSQHNPPPPSSPPPSHSLHPPPPPTASFPPPLNHSGSKPSSRHLSNKEAARPACPRESAKAPSLPLKQQEGIAAPPTVPSAAKPAHLANGPTGKVETEEERRIRKKREYEKLKQEEKRKQMMKQTQATVLQKTHMMKQAQPHGSLGGSRLADRRATPFLSGERAENRLKKPTTFLCKLKFRNELPDPTAQPKLLSTNTNKDRYASNSEKLEDTQNILSPRWRKCTSPSSIRSQILGYHSTYLTLVYTIPDVFTSLDPEDEELLRDGEIATPVKQESGIRRKDRPTDIGMHWLVKTQYISPLSMDSAKMSLTEKQAKEIRESKEGRNLFLEGLNSREKQIQAIEESFKAAKLPPVHQTKPHLRPEKIMPLLPDFSREEDQFVMVTFDGAPTADSEIYSKLDRCSRDEHESQAVMKSFVVNGSDPVKQEKFLAYMVPTPGELSKDIYDENEEMSYSWVREYHWDVRGDDATDPTTYLVNFDDDVARYLPLPTRLVLQKKKAKEGRSTDEIEHYPVPRSVTVRREGAFVEPKDNLKRGRYLRDDDDEARHKVPRMDDMDQYSGEEDIFE